MEKKQTIKKITLDTLATMVQRGFANVRADLKDIRTDIANHDQREKLHVEV